MNLRFPTKQNNHDLYFVQFSIYELEKVNISVEGSGAGRDIISALGQSAKSNFNYDKKAERLIDTITLPLQTTVTENTAASFSEKSTKKLSRYVDVLSGPGDMGEAVDSLLAAGMESVAGKLGEDIKDALLGGMGKAINEQMQVIYEGPQRRKFSMEFTLVARNVADAEQMQKIRKRFHYHASPSTSNSGTFFNYPNIVRFRFLKRDNSNQFEGLSRLESLFESKYCYIESVNVEHGDGIFSEFVDMNNQASTGIMKVSLELQEAEYMLKDDFWSEEDNA